MVAGRSRTMIKTIRNIFVVGFFAVVSIAGLLYPILNPTQYAELMRSQFYVPMVQHNVPMCLVAEMEHPAEFPTITCDKPLLA